MVKQNRHKAVLVVAALIEDDQKRLLMVREAKPEHLGRWSQPAGHVDPGEGIAEALLREVREESGYLHVRVDGIYRIYYFLDDGVLRINFKASLLDGSRGPLADDVLEAGWFCKEELEALKLDGKLRNRRTEMAIEDWLEGTWSAGGIIRTLSGC